MAGIEEQQRVLYIKPLYGSGTTCHFGLGFFVEGIL